MRGVGVQPILSRATSNQLRSEIRRLQKKMLCLGGDSTSLSTHDARHRERLPVVRDQQSAGIQCALFAIQQHDFFSGFRLAHPDAALKTIKVKSV